MGSEYTVYPLSKFLTTPAHCVRKSRLMLFPNRQLRQRIFRGVAILFLLYTGVDLLAPQICAEEGGLRASANVTVQLTVLRPDVVGQSDVESKGTQIPDEPTSQDEDCFCCCAHIVAATVFDGNSVSEITSISGRTPQALIPLERADSYFHPPRFA